MIGHKASIGTRIKLGVLAIGLTFVGGANVVFAKEGGHNFYNVAWTEGGVACVLGTDGTKTPIKTGQFLPFDNGTVSLIQESHGGTKLGGPIGWQADLDNDGIADISRAISFAPGRCK